MKFCRFDIFVLRPTQIEPGRVGYGKGQIEPGRVGVGTGRALMIEVGLLLGSYCERTPLLGRRSTTYCWTFFLALIAAYDVNVEKFCGNSAAALGTARDLTEA